MRYFVKLDGTEHVVDVSELPGGGLDVNLVDEASGKSRPLAVEASSKSSPMSRLFFAIAIPFAPLACDGVSALVGASGTTMAWPHWPHLPFLPASFAFALMVLPQLGQGKAIGAGVASD